MISIHIFSSAYDEMLSENKPTDRDRNRYKKDQSDKHIETETDKQDQSDRQAETETKQDQSNRQGQKQT